MAASPRLRAGAAGSGTVSVAVVARLIDIGVEAGMRRDLLMGAARVDEQSLHDPDARVPLAAEIAVWQTLAKHTRDPEFGVRIGRQYQLRHIGLLGYVVRFSTTLRAALRRVQRYGRVFTEAVAIQLDERQPVVALAKAHPALGPGQDA
jgi:hypothetical protein